MTYTALELWNAPDQKQSDGFLIHDNRPQERLYNITTREL